MTQLVRSGATQQPPFIGGYLDGPLKLIAPSVGLPVALEAARTQCLIDSDITSQDAWMTAKINSVRDGFERECGGIQLLYATWELPLATWWGGWSGGVPGIYGMLGLSYGLQCSDGTLRLPRAPLVQVVSVGYYDASDTYQAALGASNYVVRTYFKQPGEIDRAPLAVWPSVSPYRQYPVAVRFIAGYAAVVTAVDATANTITVAGGRTWAVGDEVLVSNSGGGLPGGLSANTTYYVQAVSGAVLTLSATSGGSAIDITSAGTGTQYVGEVPPEIQEAILMAVAHGYRNREPNAEDEYLRNAMDYYAGHQWAGGYS